MSDRLCCRLMAAMVIVVWVMGVAGLADGAPAVPERGGEMQAVLDNIFSQVLEKMPDSPLPGEITGEVRCRSLRTASGWVLLLRDARPAKDAVEPVTATVDLTSLRPCRIRDMVTGEDFEFDKFEARIEPGKYRILQILAGQFEPEYIWEYFEGGKPEKRFLCEWY